MSALMAGQGCWLCGGLVSNRRLRMVQVWDDEGQSWMEWVCEVCWQEVEVKGSAGLERSGGRYVVRCIVGSTAVVSCPDGAAGSSP